MPYNFLYIDDEKKEKVDGTITGLNQGSYLNIIFANPDPSWDNQIKSIVDSQKDIGGIILDLRLQEETNSEKGGKASYRGSSLAQELRTLSKEGRLKDLPIILLSATEQIDKSFDSTGIDLFDLRIVKDQVTESDYPKIRKQLLSLANAYEGSHNITVEKVPEGIEQIMGDTQNITTDFRLKDALSHYIIDKKPFHQISNFFLKGVIFRPGVLIDEQYLAARLGVDKEKSTQWSELKTIVEMFKYKGSFRDGWDRWWAQDLPKWWKEKISDQADLQSLSAEERVAILKEKTGLTELHYQVKLPKCTSDKFWVVCKGTRTPLALIDGFRTISGLHTYPWQEQEYVSIDAALDRTNISDWKSLSPLENDRLEKMKKIFTLERKR